ncbi:hypothetical protein Dimus_029072 [Dionaea muscipula]
MELIKRRKWENLFKRRELVHTDVVKEFYAKMTSDSLEEKGYCEVQRSGEKFYDAEEDAQGSPELPDEIPADATPSLVQRKDKGIAGVDPSGPTSREADFLKFQAEFERKRANKFHDELEKAKAENAKLLALLHQAQTKPHP